jgi:hypothetical protein
MTDSVNVSARDAGSEKGEFSGLLLCFVDVLRVISLGYLLTDREDQFFDPMFFSSEQRLPLAGAIVLSGVCSLNSAGSW